jgi:hypothetical protein
MSLTKKEAASAIQKALAAAGLSVEKEKNGSAFLISFDKAKTFQVSVTIPRGREIDLDRLMTGSGHNEVPDLPVQEPDYREREEFVQKPEEAYKWIGVDPDTASMSVIPLCKSCFKGARKLSGSV